MTRRVTVEGARPYDVVIGRGLTPDIIAAIPERAEQVAVIHAPVFKADAVAFAVHLKAKVRRVLLIELPDAVRSLSWVVE